MYKQLSERVTVARFRHWLSALHLFSSAQLLLSLPPSSHLASLPPPPSHLIPALGTATAFVSKATMLIKVHCVSSAHMLVVAQCPLLLPGIESPFLLPHELPHCPLLSIESPPSAPHLLCVCLHALFLSLLPQSEGIPSPSVWLDVIASFFGVVPVLCVPVPNIVRSPVPALFLSV